VRATGTSAAGWRGAWRLDGPTALRDAAAGLSVALVLVPQSLAYAELAGMPAYTGLWAAALPAIAASLFASSPYLQTGPTAMASLLTLAALLALVVGAVRVGVALLRWGVAAYLLSQTVLVGFTSAAALLIVASQLPTALGARPPEGGVLGQAAWVLTNPAAWDATALALSAGTLLLIAAGRRLHRLFPGVLVAVILGILYTRLTAYAGPVVGGVDAGFPELRLGLPYGALPQLLLPALVIALVGFAEPASIARAFAAQDRSTWSANREFLSQGVANLAAGASGGFPVGGSFSRSALDRAAGARTRLSGAITGLLVLLFLPFAALVSPLPRAVLAAVVLGAVAGLLQPRAIGRLWHFSKPQFGIAAATFALTLALAPNIERAVLLGSLLAIVIHLWRELRLDVREWSDGDTLHLRPMGVLWFGSANTLEVALVGALNRHPEARRLVVHLDGLGRMDMVGALTIRSFFEDAHGSGLATDLADVPPHSRRLVESVLGGGGVGTDSSGPEWL
jgi:SulP family sulfate permease